MPTSKASLQIANSRAIYWALGILAAIVIIAIIIYLQNQDLTQFGKKVTVCMPNIGPEKGANPGENDLNHMIALCGKNRENIAEMLGFEPEEGWPPNAPEGKWAAWVKYCQSLSLSDCTAKSRKFTGQWIDNPEGCGKGYVYAGYIVQSWSMPICYPREYEVKEQPQQRQDTTGAKKEG